MKFTATIPIADLGAAPCGASCALRATAGGAGSAAA